MALHTETDAYKTGFELFKTVTAMVKNMERSFKQLIGTKIINEMGEVVTLVYRANVADDKVPYLSKLIERVKLIESLFQLAWDTNEITDRQYARVIQLTTSISKQAVKWREWSANRPSHGGSRRHD